MHTTIAAQAEKAAQQAQKYEALLRSMAFLRMLVREELLPPKDAGLAQDILDAYDYPKEAA